MARGTPAMLGDQRPVPAPRNATEPSGRRRIAMLTRRAIVYLVALAALCALAAPVIGPIRGLVLFVAVVAIVAVVIGGYFLFLWFFWPDSNGDNWFSGRNRR